MDRYGVHTRTEAVTLALRHLAGQPMTRGEGLAMRGNRLIDEPVQHEPHPRGSSMPDQPFMEELLHRLRQQWPDAAFTSAGDGLTCTDPAAGAVTVITSESELVSAVTAAGRDTRDALWPGSTIEAAGFNILLVHLDEILRTGSLTGPLRITHEGLVWPPPGSSGS